MSEKKYFWLKLQENFMNSKEIKKLRRIAGGDTYTCIYLKLLLLSIKDEGKIYFEGIEENIVEELSLEIDETVENIQMTLSYLEKHKLIELVNNQEFILNYAENNIGSRSSVAERVMRHRSNKKTLQCNANMLQSNNDVTPLVTCNTEKRREEKRREEKEYCASNDSHHSNSDDFFEEIWSKYPNKKGKSSISKSKKNALLKDKLNVENALANYMQDKDLKINGGYKPFLNGNTFFGGRYKDYLETESKLVQQEVKKEFKFAGVKVVENIPDERY